MSSFMEDHPGTVQEIKNSYEKIIETYKEEVGLLEDFIEKMKVDNKAMEHLLNQRCVLLVEKGYKEAAKANCFARRLGDIGECVEGYWLSSDIKKELDYIKEDI